MAYAALISLKLTIDKLLNGSHTSIVPPCPHIELVSEQTISLLELLEAIHSWEDSSSIDETKIAYFDDQIREAVCNFEDALESHVTKQIFSQSESCVDERFSIDLKGEVVQEMILFTERARKIKEAYREYDAGAVPRHTEDNLKGTKYYRRTERNRGPEIVGQEDGLRRLKTWVNFGSRNSTLSSRTMTIVGMIGIGKTTLAKRFYESVDVMESFDKRYWLTIGQKYRLRDILLSFFDVMGDRTEDTLSLTDDQLCHRIRSTLRQLKYFIVLDDIWHVRAWDDLRRWFPDDWFGSKILLTTRLQRVAEYVSHRRMIYKMPFLNDEDSWYLFCWEFAFEIPYELQKVGKKIVKNCEGLPLAIICAANHLSQKETTLEYWNHVAERKIPIFNYPEVTQKLLESYNYLHLSLKVCFLYTGVFPLEHDITVSKLIRSWSAEGFLELDQLTTLEDTGIFYLTELVNASVVLVRQHSSKGRIKICGVHYIFQDLLVNIARKDKFFLIGKTFDNSFIEDIKGQRRLCLHNNVLLGIKDARNLIESVSTTMRSVLCTGPYHQYPVPMSSGLWLLRVLEALTIRFYSFPDEVLKLFQLRYHAITYDGKLPPSIYKLWDLHYLIVHRHFSIRTYGVRSYLPTEIWKMKKLRHLQVMGDTIPDPCGAILPNLEMLLDTSVNSCTKEIFEGIPNLRKLGILIELPLDNVQPLCSLDNLIQLEKLQSLKCIVVNPNGSQVVTTPDPTLSLPLGLKKITLSGLGYPWECMKQIAELPSLKVLKLRSYAFRGPEWIINRGKFRELKYLLIEDADLMYLELPDYLRTSLCHVVLRHCYRLKKLPPTFADSFLLETLDLEDCSTAAVASARKIAERGRRLELLVKSSAHEKPKAS